MDLFYKSFEDEFRGSRASIKQRLYFYLPLIQGLKSQFDTLKVLDLGCGRGEWLELLQENGVEAHGVDLDEGMLSECLNLNLSCSQDDVMNFLKRQSDATFEVISSYHLIEHLPFEILKDMIAECFRVLKPGGILILETPNCENILVGSGNFYLDPTHTKPLPSQLVSFLTLFCGFKQNYIHFLNSPVDNSHDTLPSLSKIFYNIGADYAVIAQKEGASSAAILLENFSNQHVKKNLHQLIHEYDENLARMFKLLYFINRVLNKISLQKLFKKLGFH